MNNASRAALAARNKAIERAFLTIARSVKAMISQQPDRRNRRITERDHRDAARTNWTVYEVISPQFYLLLEQDERERYWISFGIDPRTDQALNTRFLRLVFAHTGKTRTQNIEDCLCLDQVFLNTAELFELTASNASTRAIAVPEFDFDECFLKN